MLFCVYAASMVHNRPVFRGVQGVQSLEIDQVKVTKTEYHNAGKAKGRFLRLLRLFC